MLQFCNKNNRAWHVIPAQKVKLTLSNFFGKDTASLRDFFFDRGILQIIMCLSEFLENSFRDRDLLDLINKVYFAAMKFALHQVGVLGHSHRYCWLSW